MRVLLAMSEGVKVWCVRAHRSIVMPVDIAGLCAFRMLFGFTMAAALLRFSLRGWVEAQLTIPRFHFAYPGLTFIELGPAPWVHLLVAFLIFCALCIALGIHTRVAAFLFALGFTYIELFDQANYLNHYYLVSLLAFLLSLLPSGRAYSVDVWLRPERGVDQVPRYCVLALQVQVAVVYLFAGVAKLNADWLLDAQPMRIWLAARSDLPWLGPWLANAWVAYAASWAGALFDLTLVPFLLSSRTRRWAFLAAVVFHVATGLLFPIGAFPWLMTACLTLFFDADWPRRLWFAPLTGRPARMAPASRWLLVVLAMHALIQVCVPIFQYRFDDSAWTYRGFNFAWRVMVAEKTGYVTFRVEDLHTGAETRVLPSRYVTPLQARTLVQDPALIADLARHIATEQARLGRAVAVYADAFASLNGRPVQRLIDPDCDLTQPLGASFILPLHKRSR